MLILKLDTEEWIREDYTSTSGNGISFTIYTEEKMVNTKNLTGYTLKIKFIRTTICYMMSLIVI